MNAFEILRQHRQEIMAELILKQEQNEKSRDIIIVVHDQLEYTRACIKSIGECTKNYRILVHDNASGPETAEYLNSALSGGDIHILRRSEENLGFIVPNNRLAAESTADFLVLLNSDCEVKLGWDDLMCNYLDFYDTVGAVGYCGGILNSEGLGTSTAIGDGIDYVCGWCMCVPRKVYLEHGLFDEEHLEFAYGEDSDFCLRLREAGLGVYALHANLVLHHGNKTVVQVHRELGDYIKGTFDRNHRYIRERWSNYLIRN